MNNIDKVKAIQGLLGVVQDGQFGPESQGAMTALLTQEQAQAQWNGFTPTIDGEDVLLLNVTATCFGGIADVLSGADNGQTASGKATAVKDASGNWMDTHLLAVALPIESGDENTAPSPLAVTPQIPWGSKVKVWTGPEATPGTSLMTTVEDDGPNVRKYPTHALDLTPSAAAFFAPNMPYDQLADGFEITLSCRIYGAAKYLQPAGAGNPSTGSGSGAVGA